MKNKILNIALIGAALMATTSCSDFLETKSVSTADGEFVFSNMTTARAAMNGAYSEWHGAVSAHIFGDGLFYALDIAGSDIMRHPEKYANQLPRHQAENFYEGGAVAGTYNPVTYGKEAPNSPYAVLFSVVGKANAIASAIEGMDGYAELQQQTSPSNLSQLYGEAVCLRATAYRELIKYYGDVPYQSVFGVAAGALVCRDSIYDVIIKDVQRVAPLMYPVGKDDKNFFSSTYAYALIGRLALEAAGYQTRRGDMTYVDGEGNALTFETLGTANNNATYGRRSDWRKLYDIAKEAYRNCLANLGACSFGSSYSTFFDELHADDNGFATESIYEEPFSQGASGNDPRSYSLGRPSSGGSSKAYPCKAYGQGRINPAFYYGVFDPNDTRRDLSCTVTGSTGKGFEKLISFKPGSKSDGGGICCNKFDECRQPVVWTANQRRSGINAPYLRLSEVYLGYAEACAVTGDEATAKEYLAKVRNRAFNGNGNVDAFIASEGSLFKVVCEVVYHRSCQNGRSSCGCCGAGCCGVGACACCCGGVAGWLVRVMRHAVSWLYHRPLYSWASMSKSAVTFSPTLGASSLMRSSPNMRRQMELGYRSWSLVITKSRDAHSLPFWEVPLAISETWVIFPVKFIVL